MDNEQTKLPAQYQPISAWGYFGYSILFNLPVIGIIFLIIFSFDSSNINRRNYARSFFCVYILAFFVILFACLLGGFTFATIFSSLKQIITG